jgi:hypothetical protein
VDAEIEGKARITSFSTADEASAAARVLLEAGIPPVVDSDINPVTDEPRHWVLTLPVDAARAYETLGVSPPDRIETVPTEGPITKAQAKWRIPREKLGRYLALYIFLVLVVCVIAFFVTVWLLGGLDERGELPEDHPLTTATTI